MPTDEHTVTDPDGCSSVVFRWLPSDSPRAVLHILHGWGEHALRYERVATKLASAGFAVYADDHRGHGQTGVRSGTLGDLGPRGMDGVLDAVRAVSIDARGRHERLPLFVLGHSWGSFLLQRYLARWSADLAGALLTGTTFRDPDAPAERRPRNETFEPARTAYDWLTRDEAEVDKYIADPLCGFEVMRAAGSPAATGSAAGGASTAVPPAPLRADLPVFIFNGAADPIGGAAGGERLRDHYVGQGLTDVTLRTYAGARHELFNETNRDEVEADVLAWLDARVSSVR